MDVPERKWWMWLRRELFVLTARQLTCLLVALQILDWGTTHYLITSTEGAVEANPFLAWVMSLPYGMAIFALLKAVACVGLSYVVPWSLRKSPNQAWVWRWLAIFYFLVVLGNTFWIAMAAYLS